MPPLHQVVVSIDNCLLEFQRMADALAQVGQSTGTQIVYSLCEWGWVSLELIFAYLECLLEAILEPSLAVSPFFFNAFRNDC